jgi:hypothetical protein
MQFCTSCGATIPNSSPLPNDPYSSSADTLILEGNRQTTPTNWPNFADTYKAPPQIPEAKKSKTGLIISVVAIVAVVGVLAVAGGVGYYYYSKSEPEVTDDGGGKRGVFDPSTSDDKPGTKKDDKSEKAKPSPTNAQSFEPPTEPTRDGSFTVYANGEWQLSNIAVVPEEEYTTTVDGIVDLAGSKAGVRAGGTNAAETKSRRLFPEWPTGALLMRTRYADGRFSNTMAVAAGRSTGSWKNLPDERGMLEFRINDNAPQNNGGQFTIRKKFTKVPKKK